ncbi:MAG: gliding motility-associated C-terminal domain-containing protein [Saprospiraceae bacterium]|nr:gliding motility-associated C-terminal domain-containing protein [Saprospiraceae bacterium]MCF8439092.1 gliding motility-associated C-terminal domain-containing protein [Saprospiraceae bacterium]
MSLYFVFSFFCSLITKANNDSCFYIFSVNDKPKINSFNLTKPLPIVTGVVYQDTCGFGVGSIDITVLGGASPYTFSWSNGAMTEDISGLLGGFNYGVIVTDANGDFVSVNFFVNNHTQVGVTHVYDYVLLQNTACIGPPNGGIELTPLTNLPFNWTWSNGINTLDNLGLPSGGYAFTINGPSCTHTFTFNIYDDTDDPHLTGLAADPTCGEPNGSINLTVMDGTPAYTFEWSNGATTEDLSGLAPGGYSVTVTDSGGCTDEEFFFLQNAPGFTVAVAATPASSCLSDVGALDLTPSPPGSYTFAWDNGAVTEDIGGLPPGTYSVTVTDADGCTQAGQYDVADTALPPTLAATATAATCGLPSGSVGLNVTGGAQPYTFAWDGGATTPGLTNVPPGSYAVTVTGANGCTATASATVPDTDINIALSGTPTPNTSCTASPNGGIATTVSPPVPPTGSYAYNWNNGSTTTDLAPLPGGSYALTVSVGNCTATASFTVEDEPEAIVLATQATPAACGQSNGSVDLSATLPGTPVLNYEWSSGETTEDISGVPAGGYTVTVTSPGTGCTATASATVGSSGSGTDTTLLAATTCDPNGAGTFVQNLTGQGGCDSIIITNITYAAADTTEIYGTSCDINAVGIFEQTLTNGNGCDSLIITAITYAAADTTNISGTSCDINEVGIFEETLTNNNSCDSLIITNMAYAAADTTNIFGLSCDINEVGIFEQTLTNNNGCDSLIITNITYAAADTTNISGTSCDISDVGIFEEILTNDSGCDSLIITNITYAAADTTNILGTSCDINEVGIFEEILTNGDGCDSLIITNIAYAAADTTNISGTSCDISEVGIFEETLTNGDGCDSLIITNIAYAAADTTNISGTSCDINEVGIFEEILTNDSGCDSLIITTIAYSAADTTNISGTSCDISDVGIFEETLTNTDGCDSLIITTVTLLPSTSTSLSATTCDPAMAGIFTENLTTWQGCDSTVTTTVTLLPSTSTSLTATTCDPAMAGIFTENLSTWQGCDSIVTTTVSLLPSSETFLTGTTCDPTLAGVFTENLTTWQGCDSTVTTTVSLLPNSETFLTGTTCDPAMAGIFTENLSTWQGCDSIVTTTVSLTPPPTLTLASSDFSGFGVSCHGASDGWAQASATGVPPFGFVWENGTQTPLVEGLPPGVYPVTVTDGNGCSSVGSVEITGPGPLSNSLTINGLGCFDDNGGAVTVTASGGVPPYLYAVDNGPLQASGTFGGLGAGAYQVTVQDANGCSATDLVAINAPVQLSVELGDDVFLELGDGAVLSALTNVPPGSLVNVDWTGIGNLECPECPNQQVFPVVTTAYSVTVSDAQGCSASDGVTVYVDRRKNVYVPNAFSPNGDGINDLLLVFAKEGQVEKVNSFLVFDRWGESVFRYTDFLPNDPAFGWDGTHRGQLLDAAVFVWFAEVAFVDGSTELFEGGVVLVR